MYNNFMSQFLTSLFHLDLSILFFFLVEKRTYPINGINTCNIPWPKKEEEEGVISRHTLHQRIHPHFCFVNHIGEGPTSSHTWQSEWFATKLWASRHVVFLKKKKYIYILFWINHHVDFRSCIKKGTYKS